MARSGQHHRLPPLSSEPCYTHNRTTIKGDQTQRRADSFTAREGGISEGERATHKLVFILNHIGAPVSVPTYLLLSGCSSECYCTTQWIEPPDITRQSCLKQSGAEGVLKQGKHSCTSAIHKHLCTFSPSQRQFSLLLFWLLDLKARVVAKNKPRRTSQQI